MENPKIRIESNGKVADVYIDGEQISRCRMIDFSFHGDADNGIHIIWDGEMLKVNEHGLPYDVDGKIATEKFHYDGKEAVT